MDTGKEIERYARAWATVPNGYEVSLGVEYRSSDDVSDMSSRLQALGKDALVLSSFQRIADFAEAIIKAMWPGRAFFVEVDDGKCGVQVYAPYGIPKWK